MTKREFQIRLKRLKIKQNEFAEMLGICRESISRWNDQTLPKYAVLIIELLEALPD